MSSSCNYEELSICFKFWEVQAGLLPLILLTVNFWLKVVTL